MKDGEKTSTLGYEISEMQKGKINFFDITLKIIVNIILNSRNQQKFKLTSVHDVIQNSAKDTSDTKGGPKGF